MPAKSPEKMANACLIRLLPRDKAKLEVAAADLGVSVHEMGRMIILNYLAGYQGPYVMRRPAEPLG